MDLPSLKLHFDAACKNTPNTNNPMGIGVAVFVDEEYREDLSLDINYTEYKIDGTNNVGEWLGLIDCIKHVKNFFSDLYPKDHLFYIYSDSQLVVKQFNGVYAVKKQHLKPLFIEAKTLSAELNILVQWVPREENQEADDLSKKALKQQL